MQTSGIPADTERLVIRLVRVASLTAIAVGVLSLLVSSARVPPVLRLAPHDALGLLFIGFAIRFSRLADYRTSYRVMLHTCRVSLLLLGAIGLASPDPARFSSGLCFVLAGAILLLRRRYVASVVANRLCSLLTVYIGACWVALVLYLAQIAPVPWPVAMHPLLLVSITAAAIGLSAFTRNPGIVQLLAGQGVENEVARHLFAASLCIPVVVAVLSRVVESAGWLHSGLLVLVQVLVSVGCMIAVSLMQSRRVFQLRRSVDAVSTASHSHEHMYHQILDSLEDPIWIFDRAGHLSFLNSSARSFSTPGAPAGTWESVLDRGQQHSVLNAALFGYRHPEISLRHTASGAVRTLPIRYLAVCGGDRGGPEQIVLVANSQPCASRPESK